MEQGGYSQRVPNHDYSTCEPVAMPPHFGDILLNTRIKPVDPFTLPMPAHVTLNHMYIYHRPRRRADVAVLGITQRYHTKFVTTVYYKPRGGMAGEAAAAAAAAAAATVVGGENNASAAAVISVTAPPATHAGGRFL